MTVKNKGGAPKGVPKSQIKPVITRLKEILPECFELVRRSVSYPKDLEALKRAYREGKLPTTRQKQKLITAYELGQVEEKEYQSKNNEEYFLKEEYSERKADLQVDADALRTAKWNIEKVVDFYIKAQTDEKGKIAIRQSLKELGIGREIDLSDDDDSSQESVAEGGKGNVFSLKMKDKDE